MTEPRDSLKTAITLPDALFAFFSGFFFRFRPIRQGGGF